MRVFFAIAGRAAGETVRQPLVLLASLTCLALQVLLAFMSVFALGGEDRWVRGSALALQFLAGILFSLWAGARVMRAHLAVGRFELLLSKPVGRLRILVGGYCGVLPVLAVFWFVTTTGVLLAVRLALPGLRTDMRLFGLLLGAAGLALVGAAFANYRWRFPFGPAAMAGLVLWPAGVLAAGVWLGAPAVSGPIPLAWEALIAAALNGLAMLVMAGLACSLGVVLRLPGAALACTILLLLGLWSEYGFAGIPAGLRWLEALLPQWPSFWGGDLLDELESVPLAYLARAAAYAGLYLTAVLGLGLMALHACGANINRGQGP